MSLTKHIKRLSWHDFKGIPDTLSKFDACINWGIYYNYTLEEKKEKRNHQAETQNQSLTPIMAEVNLDASCRMLETSWFKRGKESEHLLTHEFGHFLIAKLYAENFMFEVNKKLFHFDSIEETIKHKFNNLFDECVEYQNKYDKDTDHSLNKEIQKKWNENLNEKLFERGFMIMV